MLLNVVAPTARLEYEECESNVTSISSEVSVWIPTGKACCADKNHF